MGARLPAPHVHAACRQASLGSSWLAMSKLAFVFNRAFIPPGQDSHCVRSWCACGNLNITSCLRLADRHIPARHQQKVSGWTVPLNRTVRHLPGHMLRL